MSDRAYAKVPAQQKTLIGSSPHTSLLQHPYAHDKHTLTEREHSILNERSTLLYSPQASGSPPNVRQGNTPAQRNPSSFNATLDRASRFGHDFSRIPIHASVPRTIQMPQAGSGARDGHAQEVDNVTYDTAGKPAAAFTTDFGIRGGSPFQVARQDGAERTYAEIGNEMSRVRKGVNGPKSPEASAPKPAAKPKPSAPAPSPKPELKPEEAKKPTKPTITHETTFSAPDGTGKTRTNVGVGEEVTFTGSTAGEWTATKGTPGKLASGAKFTWTAPEREATVTIKLQVGTEEATVSMKVIEPASIIAHKIGEEAFPAGKAGAGMFLKFIYHPMNVSFGNVMTKEVSGPATNITGYYRKHNSDADLRHNSGDTFFPVKQNNEDSATDTAEEKQNEKPYERGTYDWVIPNKFKVNTEAGDGKKFTEVTQAVLMVDATGKIKITKAGAEVERSP